MVLVLQDNLSKYMLKVRGWADVPTATSSQMQNSFENASEIKECHQDEF